MAMANSQIIDTVKNKLIKELVADELIVKVIDSPSITMSNSEELLNTHIYTFNQDPFVLNDALTFLTIQVHIPESSGFGYNSTSSTFVQPQLEIWIVSHISHMKITNIPKIKTNRNDYLSILIDNKLNGRFDFGGIGKLKLVSNIEGAFQKDYVFRKMIFSTDALNSSLCDIED